MVANIDVIIERGEKLELLVDKTEHLATNSITFRWNCLLEIYYSKLYRLQEYFKKPSACHMVEKHEIDYWSGFGGHSLSLCCGITCLWGSCLVQMCGLKSLPDWYSMHGFCVFEFFERIMTSGVILNHTFFTNKVFLIICYSNRTSSDEED